MNEISLKIVGFRALILDRSVGQTLLECKKPVEYHDFGANTSKLVSAIWPIKMDRSPLATVCLNVANRYVVLGKHITDRSQIESKISNESIKEHYKIVNEEIGRAHV